MGCSHREHWSCPRVKTQRKGSPCPIKEGTLKHSGTLVTTPLVFRNSAWSIKAELF